MPVLGVKDVDVRLAEYNEQVPLARILQVARHVQISVHTRLKHRDAAELLELRGVGVVVEGAGDEHVESGVGGLAGGFHQVGAGDGAEFRADEYGCAPFLLGLIAVPDPAFNIAALGADQIARPQGDGCELDAVFTMRLLNARRLQVLQNDLGKVELPAKAALRLRNAVDYLVVLVDLEQAVRRDALDGERASYTYLAPVLVGLVVQALKLGAPGDGGVYLLLGGRCGAPTIERGGPWPPATRRPPSPAASPTPPTPCPGRG